MLGLPNEIVLRMGGKKGRILAAATSKVVFNSPVAETRVPQVIFSMLRNITMI